MKGETDIETIINALEDKFRSNEVEATDTFVNKISTLFKNNDGYYSWNSLRYFFLSTKCLYMKKLM